MKAHEKMPMRLRLAAWGVISTFWALLYSEIFGDSVLLHIGSMNLSVYEPCVAFLAAAVIAMMLRRWPRFSAVEGLLLAFSLLLFLNIVRGNIEFPLSVWYQSRKLLVFILVLLACIYLPNNPQLLARIWKQLHRASFVIAALCFLRSVFGMHLFLSADSVDLIYIDRPIASWGATMIGVASIFLYSELMQAPLHGSRKGWKVAQLGFLLAALLISKQGTSTIATLMGLAVVFACANGRYAKVRLLSGFSLALLAGGLYLTLPDLLSLESLGTILPGWEHSDVAYREGNFQTRTAIWAGIMESYTQWSLADQILGLPIGTKSDIMVDQWGGVYWQQSAHSMYFGSLMSAGCLGVALYITALLALLVSGLRRLFSAAMRRSAAPDRAMGLALCIFCIFYGISYELQFEQAWYLGASAMALRKRAALLPAHRHSPSAPGAHQENALELS